VVFYERANQCAGMKKGWEIKKLGEVCEFQNGFAFKSNLYKSTGLPVLRIKNIQKNGIEANDVVYFNDNDYREDFEKYKVLKDDLVIAMSGATTGKLGINKTDIIFYLNQRVGKFLPKKALLAEFLYYYLSNKVEENLRISAGAAQPNLSTAQIKNFILPIPPLPEQKRIVGILDKVFAAISTAKANAEKNLQNAHELFESYSQSIFANPGDGWVEKSLGSLASFRNGINYTKDSKGERIKIVGVRNFKKNFSAPMDDLNTVTINGELRKLDSLEQDNILAVRSNGNIELIGRCILVGEVTEKISHSGFTIRIRLSTGEVLPRYLCHFMKSASSRKRLTDGGTGTNIKSLNQGMLSTLAIPFPPISVQKILVEKLESLSAETKKLEAI